jgi:hypothetical protein
MGNNGKEKTRFEKLAYNIAQSAGTPLSIIIHTIFFAASFLMVILGVDLNRVMLIVTTVVSLEAIYLSLFIQLTVNWQSKHLRDVKEEIEDIQENIEDMAEEEELNNEKEI